MLKKYLGGLTLLIFTFTFAVPSFVAVNTVDAGYTNIYRQNWRTEFFCPDGTYATSSSGYKDLNSYNQNHPEPRRVWKKVHEHDPIICFIWCPRDSEYDWVYEHTDHSTYIYIDPVEDYTRVTLYNNRNYCD